MSSALAVFWVFTLFLDFKGLDFAGNYDFGFPEAIPTQTKGKGKIELVSPPHGFGDFEQPPVAQDLHYSGGTSLERFWSTTSDSQSNEDFQCPVEMPPLWATAQTQRDALSNMSPAVADGDGQELRAWCEADTSTRSSRRPSSESAELGWLCSRDALLPGVPVTSSKRTKSPTEDAKSKRPEIPSQQGRRQRFRPVQLCPFSAVSARAFSAADTADGASLTATIYTTAMDAADGQHDADAHAIHAHWQQSDPASTVSTHAHACTDVAAKCTGPGAEGSHCLPAETFGRFTARHPAEGPQHVQERRQEGRQRSGVSCQGAGRSEDGVRGSPLSTLAAHHYMESFSRGSSQQLVRLWQALRTTRRSTTIEDCGGQGAVPGCQGMHGGLTSFCGESGSARGQRRGRPAWGCRSQCDANHREHPIAVHFSPTTFQGHRDDPGGGAICQTSSTGNIKKRRRVSHAFQLGWLWTTLWCLNRQPDALDLPATQALKWSHSIMDDATFLCECGAREKAHGLALEVALSCPQVPHIGHFALPTIRSSKSSLHVGFADMTDLHIWFEDDVHALQLCLPSECFDGKSTPWSGCPKIATMKRSRFDVCPWHEGSFVRSCEHPSETDNLRITAPKDGIFQCKITDNHFDNPARRHQQQEPDAPDPDVIPDIQDAPPFAQDLHSLADMHQAFSDPDGEGILRLRTWYLHHEVQQTNFHSRTVELDEDWRRWENDIIGAWRTHLQAGASIFLHLVAPDPYRGYLHRPTHGDIIITQGNDLPRRAGLVTVHYHGGEVEPHSYAVACSLELVVSGFRFAEAADAGQWCHLPQNRCAVAFGWQTIPFDHLPRHQMHSGDSIVITITRTPTEDRARRGHPPLQGDQQIDIPQLDRDHDYEDVENLDALATSPPSHDDSSASEQPEEEVGVHIYSLEKNEAHCYIQWDTYRRILLNIVRCLRLPRNDIIGMHFVQALPVGVHPVVGRAVIIQAVGDIPAGSGEQLILLDLEIHFHALPSGLLVPPAFSRKVMRIFPPLHRSQILRMAGLNVLLRAPCRQVHRL